PVERRQVVEAADVALSDEDLRHRAAAGFLDHLVATRRLEIDVDLLDVGDAARLQKHLGALAIRAGAGAVHQDLGAHVDSSWMPARAAYLTTGNPACRQACSPPARLKTSSLPLRRSKADAL